MKKTMLTVCCLLGLCCLGVAQERFELLLNEPFVVYSLPKTALQIEVDVEKITQTPGEFYQYSGRYLAEKDVITEARTAYQLKGVRVKAQAQCDLTRTFALTAKKKIPLPNIAVDERGLLRGINIPLVTTRPPLSLRPEKPSPKAAPSDKPLPLTEEYMLASSTAKMAEGAAKQIYRIRESRIALLTADVDQLPADGESLKTMLARMDKMERELTELFTGSTVRETVTHTIDFVPTEAVDGQVLFRLSSLKGIVDANDLSGSPYYISIAPDTIGTYKKKRYKKKDLANRPALYSVLPVSTQVSIDDGKNTLFSQTYTMPQFGELIPIPTELLQGNLQIWIDENSGRLLHTSQPADNQSDRRRAATRR